VKRGIGHLCRDRDDHDSHQQIVQKTSDISMAKAFVRSEQIGILKEGVGPLSKEEAGRFSDVFFKHISEMQGFNASEIQRMLSWNGDIMEYGTVGYRIKNKPDPKEKVFNSTRAILAIRIYATRVLPREELLQLIEVADSIQTLVNETLFEMDYQMLCFNEELFNFKKMHYEKYFQDIAVPSLLMRRTGDIELVNSAFCELMQVTPEEINGVLFVKLLSTNAIFKYVRQAVFPFFAEESSELAKSLQAHLTLKRPKTGEEIEVTGSFTVKRDVKRRPLLYICSFLTISDEAK